MNAILLAGGRSKRYGSNKAMLNINGETAIKRIHTILSGTFEKVYVIGSQDSDYSFLQNAICLEDIIPDRGPLGGLYTGLVNTSSQYNFVMGCDMPFLTTAYLELLQNYPQDYQVLVPEYQGYLEPLAGIYSKSCTPAIEECLSAGILKIKGFYSSVRVKVIREEVVRMAGDPLRLFYNINYKKDLVGIDIYREAN